MSATVHKRPTLCLVTALLFSGLAGCASSFDFQPVESVPFRDRAVTQA